jgi:phytoene dehydrogenase-like protein
LLSAEQVPCDPVSSTTAYFAGTASLYDGRFIVLNANADPYVNTVVQMDNIACDYAPTGHHLVSLSLPRAASDNDADIEQQCREDLARLFPAKPIDALRLLSIYRIPFSQFAQPPGIFQRLASNTTDTEGLYLASEATASSSIQGVMSSGEAVARHILQAVKVPSPA